MTYSEALSDLVEQKKVEVFQSDIAKVGSDGIELASGDCLRCDTIISSQIPPLQIVIPSAHKVEPMYLEAILPSVSGLAVMPVDSV
jgi:hypothetical protein